MVREINSSKKDVENVLSKFRGTIKQVPPMFSAKSVDGVRLYDLARQGIEVEREACIVEIKKLELVEYENDEYIIDVLCSKGTYIRSLIDDIGRELGCGAVMTSLVRTQAMGFTLDDCVTLDELQNIKDNGANFDSICLNIEDMFKSYPKVFVSNAQAKRFSNGGALDINRIKKAPLPNEACAVYSNENLFLGLGISDSNELKVLRLLSKRD